MNAKILTPILGVLITAGTLVMGGTAHAKTASGTVYVNNADVYTVSCTATKTHCIEVQVCDADNQNSIDQWQMVLVGTAPSSLLGHAVDSTVNYPNGCGQTQLFCRTGSTIGPMKGLIA